MKCVLQSSPGGNKARSHLFIRPDVLYNDHDGNIPGPHHTQCTAKKNRHDYHAGQIIFLIILSEKISDGVFVPGILLKAYLFGDGERKNKQDCSNNDGKFAVSVPVAADRTVCFMSYSSYH